MRVFGLNTLLDDVAHHIGQAATGKLQLVAGAPAGSVGQPVVENLVHGSPAFKQMPHLGMVKIAAANGQPANGPHVNVVALPIAITVMAKLAVLNFQHRVKLVPRENAILVVGKRAIAHLQKPALKADAGTVAVRHARACKVKPIHPHLPRPHHPNGLGFCGCARCHQLDAPPHRAHGDPVLGPHRHVGPVFSRINLNNGSSPCLI